MRPSCAALLLSSLPVLLVADTLAQAKPMPPTPAFAACFDAYPAAQRLRKQGKLREARAQLVLCSQEECPAEVRSDCGTWLGEVDRAMPSVVIEARDPRGDETAAVRVLVDGVLLAERLDGKAIELDPGEHAFRFQHAGQTQERTILIREGEARRKIEVRFSTPPAASASASASAPPPPASSLPLEFSSSPEGMPRPSSTLGYALSGIGILALAGSAYFYLDGRGFESDLKKTCAPACSPDQMAPLKRRDLLAGVSLGVGVVSLGAAAYLLLRPAPAESVAARFELAPLPGGAFATYQGAF
jgi:hypothetical protein